MLRTTRLCCCLAVALPLISYPFSWLLPQWTDYRSPLLLPIATFVAMIFLLMTVIFLLREPAITVQPGIVGLSLFLAFSSILSVSFSSQPHYSIGQLPLLATNLVVFLIAAQSNASRLRSFLWCWTVTAAIVTTNGLLRLVFEPEFVSTFGNRNLLAAYLAASIPLALALRDRRVWPLIALNLIGIWLCHSRGAWIALAVIAIVFLIIRSQSASIFWRRIVWAGAALVLIVASFATPYIQRQWRTDVRPLIWQSTLRMIADKPLLGHGLGTYLIEYPTYRSPEYFNRPKAANVTDHAHNEFLEIAAEQGFVGLAATLLLWGTALWLGFRRAQSDIPTAGLLGAALILLMHGLLDVGLRHPPNQSLFWLLLGLLTASSANKPKPISPARFPRLALAAGAGLLAIWLFLAGCWNPLRADWWDRQARLADRRGNPADAIAGAENALNIQPFRIETRYFLAGVLARIPTPAARDAAIDQCQRLLEIAPDYADLRLNFGALLLDAGRPADALPHLQRAVATNPSNQNAHRLLATAQQAFDTLPTNP